jgi:Ca2+-binding RTX toxin-like protein
MRRFLAIAAALSAAMFPMLPPASAGEPSASVVDHVLTVTGTDLGEIVAIRCENGEVTVDEAAPAGGPEACSDLREIVISAGGGDDRVSLGEVVRSVFTELVSVSVAGDDGDDTLIGSDFADALSGGGGHDWIRGGAGADELAPGAGWNAINGGVGRDVASFSGGGNWFVIDGLAGRRTPIAEETTLRSIEEVEVVGGGGADLFSGASFSGILRFFGLGGNDLLNSGSKDDVLDGGPGDDWLDANAGNDVMDGGPGNDVLRGDEGNDDMNGGPGNDVCLSGPGADRAVSC